MAYYIYGETLAGSVGELGGAALATVGAETDLTLLGDAVGNSLMADGSEFGVPTFPPTEVDDGVILEDMKFTEDAYGSDVDGYGSEEDGYGSEEE